MLRQELAKQMTENVQKWVNILLTDGHSFPAFLSSFDHQFVRVFIPKNSYIALTYQGALIQRAEQAQPFINQWVHVRLTNNIVLPFYLVSFDEQNTEGFFLRRDKQRNFKFCQTISCSQERTN